MINKVRTQWRNDCGQTTDALCQQMSANVTIWYQSVAGKVTVKGLWKEALRYAPVEYGIDGNMWLLKIENNN